MMLPSRHALAVLAAAIAATATTATAASPPAATSAANPVVVRAHRVGFSVVKGTITYASGRGRYTATWIGKRHYRLRGRIDGRRLTGTIRTRQAPSGDRYRARGSGRFGSRRVRLTGGGPNDLSRATLVLR